MIKVSNKARGPDDLASGAGSVAQERRRSKLLLEGKGLENLGEVGGPYVQRHMNQYHDSLEFGKESFSM